MLAWAPWEQCWAVGLNVTEQFRLFGGGLCNCLCNNSGCLFIDVPHVQVFYVPDGSGGFIEIVDGGGAAGVFTVASMSADTVAGMLSLEKAPFGATAAAVATPAGANADDAAAGIHRGDPQGPPQTADGSGGERGRSGRKLFFGGGESAEMMDRCGAAGSACPRNACTACMCVLLGQRM